MAWNAADGVSLKAPVSTDFLRGLSKELHTYIPADSAISNDSVNKLANLLRALVETAAISHIPASQRAGACNPLCSLLERCLVSTDERIYSLVWTKNIWTALFDVFLERYDNAKPKSMRQVLLCLCSILLKGTSTAALTAMDQLVVRLFGILFQEDGTPKVKPALIALSHIIDRHVITVDEIITAFERWYLAKGKSLRQFPAPDTAIKIFTYGIMNWVAHHDTAPAAGHAVSVIVDQEYQKQRTCSNTSHSNILPYWTEPLERSIRRHTDAVSNFQNHLFPDLFKSRPAEYLRFLEHLHLVDHIQPGMGAGDFQTLSDRTEASLLFASLQVGKNMGWVQEVDYCVSRRVQIRQGIILIPDRLLGRLLGHELPGTRLAALTLLTTSTAVTRPLTGGTFTALRRNLPHLHADTDANFRAEVMRLTLSLFERLRGATGAMSRSFLNEQSTYEPSYLLELYRAHVQFIRWYIRFLKYELYPDAPYQRHISALKALTIVMKSGLDPSVPHHALSKTAQGEVQFPFRMNVLTPVLVRELFDLLMDPFDDVRCTAASLLQLVTHRILGPFGNLPRVSRRAPLFVDEPVDSVAHFDQNFYLFLTRAEKMMLRSGRADHADGVARAYGLLFQRVAALSTPQSPKDLDTPDWASSRQGIVVHLVSLLDKTIAAASSNLSVAINTYPMHGTLAALRCVFDQPTFYEAVTSTQGRELEYWRSLHNSILHSLCTIWDCVRAILCVDAPEGHVPEDMEEDVDLMTKDVLSYSWRGLKEASSLLRVIVARAPLQPIGETVIISIADFKRLGELCFHQLVELRHRGAFSTVAQTFATICLRCRRCRDPEVNKLLDVWYKGTLHCINDKAATITRRSAGLPSLITGILAAGPDDALLFRCIEDLMREAVKEGHNTHGEASRLPQVHALNCLRGIFTNSQLASASEPFVAEGLSLAASRLESRVWAIRNCGLMLFRALVDRLLGSSTTQNWTEADRLKITRLSYQHYPNVLDIIVRLLTPSRPGGSVELAESALEGVFPALQILQRARPPADRMAEIRQLVLSLTTSSHWHVRSMAARTLAVLLGIEERVEWVLALVECSRQRQNALHGALMSIWYLLKEMYGTPGKDTRGDVELVGYALSEQFARLYKWNPCPLTRSAYLDIVTLIQKYHIISDDWEIVGEAFGGEAFDYLVRDASNRVKRFGSDQSQPNSGKSAGDSLLRKSLAIFAVQHLILSTSTAGEQPLLLASVASLFQHISDKDGDTCRLTLESLMSIMHASILHASPAASSCLIRVLSIAATSPDLEIVATVQHAFAKMLDCGLDIPTACLVPMVLGSEQQPQMGTQGSPLSQQGAVLLLGRYIDARMRESSTAMGEDAVEEKQTMHLLAKFIRTLRVDLDDDQPLPTRIAAISALDALRTFWRRPRQRRGTERRLALALALSLITYDALNDDNDGIRAVAARIAMRIITPSQPAAAAAAVPLVASRALAAYLGRSDARHASRLRAEALERMLGRCGSVAAALAAARAEDEAACVLFAREKRNLFADAVREVGVWGDVLVELGPGDGGAAARWLEQWCVGGLQAMRDAAVGEREGTMGWARKGEVFLLGWRVVGATRLMLAWTRPEAARPGGSTIRKALRETVDAWVQADVHGLWVDEAERLLSESVLAKLADVRRVLAAAVSALIS